LEDSRGKIEEFLSVLSEKVSTSRGSLCHVFFPGNNIKRVTIGNAVLDLMFDSLGRVVVPPNLGRLVLEADTVVVGGEELRVAEKERVEDENGDTDYWALHLERKEQPWSFYSASKQRTGLSSRSTTKG